MLRVLVERGLVRDADLDLGGHAAAELPRLLGRLVVVVDDIEAVLLLLVRFHVLLREAHSHAELRRLVQLHTALQGHLLSHAEVGR